ncbi:MAG: hypothetical protein AAGK21_03675, partial [Bacteroidota bacterium]
MEPQGLDRTALLGILLMSLILGVWMIQSAPPPEEIEARRAAADSIAAVRAAADSVADAAEAVEEDAPLAAPTDSA